MKKILYISTIGLILTFLSFSQAFALWDDCPKGEVNDPYPGECSKYIDTDGDGICDHSQPAPEDRIAEEATSEDATYTATPLIEETTSNTSVSPTPTSSATSTKTTTNTAQPTTNTKKAESNSKYNFWMIFVSLVIVYVISYVLTKTKTISVVAHRKFWNVMLLVTFIVCGLTGIFLTIRVENPGLFTLPSNFLFLHVEFGLAMALISIFHILWHWKYYINILKSKPKTNLQDLNNTESGHKIENNDSTNN